MYNSIIDEWAARWGVPSRALTDLDRMIREASDVTDPRPALGDSEAYATNDIRLEASQRGCRLWRNNVGAYEADGRWIRYGLCNDSRRMNEQIKSSDLIGIRPVRITGEHIGQVIGQFVAREVKASGWRYAATARERAQLAFIALVRQLGGDAQFATGRGTI